MDVRVIEMKGWEGLQGGALGVRKSNNSSARILYKIVVKVTWGDGALGTGRARGCGGSRAN